MPLVVWEVTEVEGWSRRIVSLRHMTKIDDDTVTSCGVPVPEQAKYVTEDNGNRKFFCSKCDKAIKILSERSLSSTGL